MVNSWDVGVVNLLLGDSFVRLCTASIVMVLDLMVNI